MTNLKFFITAASIVFTSAVPVFAQSLEAQVERLGELPTIRIVDLKSVQRGKFIAVQASIENTTLAGISLAYRFKWFDASGFIVGTEEAYEPKFLNGREILQISGMSKIPTATDFKLVLHAK
jgi:uncharacterized protein YcfL